MLAQPVEGLILTGTGATDGERREPVAIHAAKLTGGVNAQYGVSSDPCSETYRWGKRAVWGKQ
jgi:hypothetical protein